MEIIIECVVDLSRSEGQQTLVGKHDTDIMVGFGDDVLARSNHTSESSIHRIEHAVFLDIEEILLHLTIVAMCRGGCTAAHIGCGVVDYPYEHTHVSIVGVIRNGEFFLVLTTATNFDTLGQGSFNDVFIAIEIIFSIAVVVYSDTKGGCCG